MLKALKPILMATVLCVVPMMANADMYNDGRHQTGFFHAFSHPFHDNYDMRNDEFRGFNTAEKRDLQRALKERGYYRGRIDGVWGSQTLLAVRNYQASVGLAPSGILTGEDLRNLGIYSSDTMTTTETETTTHYTEKVDIVTHGNSGTAHGARAFME